MLLNKKTLANKSWRLGNSSDRIHVRREKNANMNAPNKDSLKVKPNGAAKNKNQDDGNQVKTKY